VLIKSNCFLVDFAVAKVAVVAVCLIWFCVNLRVRA